MAQVNEMEIKEAYQVLNEMMNTFEGWFPIDETDSKNDIETYRERFAATKLCLELGEYTRYDYEYLFFVCDIVVDRKLYFKAINVFISALSEEYGWI